MALCLSYLSLALSTMLLLPLTYNKRAFLYSTVSGVLICASFSAPQTILVFLFKVCNYFYGGVYLGFGIGRWEWEFTGPSTGTPRGFRLAVKTHCLLHTRRYVTRWDFRSCSVPSVPSHNSLFLYLFPFIVFCSFSN